ncbi:MAG TPA: hypothetical protein VHZ56_11860, partial [Devosia sp.]|nr:hypothetical protein [Devosia sp.]
MGVAVGSDLTRHRAREEALRNGDVKAFKELITEVLDERAARRAAAPKTSSDEARRPGLAEPEPTQRDILK